MKTNPTLLQQVIRSARQAAGLTPTELAYHLGVSEASIRFWEGGHSRPHPLRLAALAKALKIDKSMLDQAYANDNGEAA